MVYDDIIVGSGLTALATALGLPPGRSVCVLAGPAERRTDYYNGTNGIPCSILGVGGLGAFWHGVIPVLRAAGLGAAGDAPLAELFNIFYPRESLGARVGQPWLFVPYRPIRPAEHWSRLVSARGGRVHVEPRVASRVTRESAAWTVTTTDGRVRGRRVWMAAGALGTPGVLAASPGLAGAHRANASDHVIIYLGQIDRQQHPAVEPPKVERGVAGVWMAAQMMAHGEGQVTTKPARFDYATLDYGIEQRAAFGLPTAGVLGKLARARSLGLLAESVFNKFGLFPTATRLSAYAQIRVDDAYGFEPGHATITPHRDVILQRIDRFRAAIEWPALTPSRRPDLYVPGIHLHGTLDRARLQSFGVDAADSDFAVVDPSTLTHIGPEHHTFGTMVGAFLRARLSA